MSIDKEFTATGPASVGFQTAPASTPFGTGVEAQGLSVGVSGIGTGGTKPNTGGIGVRGTGTGVQWGVEGIGGNAVAGSVVGDASQSAGVLGTGGQGPQSGAPGVVGLGAPAPGVPPSSRAEIPNVPPGSPGPGVIGQGGPNVGPLFNVHGGADGVQGFGVGSGSGVAGFADNNDKAIFGGANSGVGVFGQGGGPPRTTQGVPAAPGGPGVRGIGGINQNGGNADGVQGFGRGTFSGVTGIGDPHANGTGVFGLGGGTSGPGVRGIGAGGPFTAPSFSVGVYGQAGPNGDGVQGVGSIGVRGVSGGNAGDTGVLAVGNPSQIALFASGSGGEAGVFHGPVIVFGNFFVTAGTKSAVVPFPDGSHRQLYCMESPESWFEDFGFGQLTNGVAHIQLDPDFATTIHTDVYHVFITEYGDNTALYVTNRTNTGFEVRAKTSKGEAMFSYRVVAKRKDITPGRLEKVTLPTESLEKIKSKVAELPGRSA
jgi:hypothetical protein